MRKSRRSLDWRPPLRFIWQMRPTSVTVQADSSLVLVRDLGQITECVYMYDCASGIAMCHREMCNVDLQFPRRGSSFFNELANSSLSCQMDNKKAATVLSI